MFTPKHAFTVMPEDVESFLRECEPIGGTIRAFGVTLAGYALRGVRTADLVTHFPREPAGVPHVCEIGLRVSSYRRTPRWCINFIAERDYRPAIVPAGRIFANVSPRLDDVSVAAGWPDGQWMRRFARAAIASADDIARDVHATYTKFYAFLGWDDVEDYVATFPRENPQLVGKTLAEVRRAVANGFHDIAVACGWQPTPPDERAPGDPYCWRQVPPSVFLPYPERSRPF